MASVKASSSIRTEQAAHTRRRILEATARVLEAQGFAGTRIDDVATEAGVAVPTVYKVFTNKVNLLIGAVNQTMAGDDAAPIDQQAWFTEQLDEPDPVRQLRLIARNARRMYERAGPLLNVLRAGRHSMLTSGRRGTTSLRNDATAAASPPRTSPPRPAVASGSHETAPPSHFWRSANPSCSARTPRATERQTSTKRGSPTSSADHSSTDEPLETARTESAFGCRSPSHRLTWTSGPVPRHSCPYWRAAQRSGSL